MSSISSASSADSEPAPKRLIRHGVDPRDGLGPYTTHPEAFPLSSVIHHNASFVYIRDRFPKAAVHALLLPRDPAKRLMHPFEAFADPVFLEAAQEEGQRLKRLVAAELKRRFGAQQGRIWEREVNVGVHARPSMNHLHIHVISQDSFSERTKSRNHYNSFHTPFFIHLDEFPLPDDDPRMRHGMRYLKQDLKCWRCGYNFKNRFKLLKEHLAVEFEEWKKAPEEEIEVEDAKVEERGDDDGGDETE